jgi:hypothetical protein
MKNNLISESEVSQILSMHKLLKEQTEMKKVTDTSSDLVMLRKAITAGCLKGGRILTNANETKYVYRATSKSGKTVDFTADMNYKFGDGSKSGKWKCDNIGKIEQQQAINSADNDSKIQTELKKGWEKLETLKSKGVDLTTLDRVYDTQVIGNVTLYRQKGKSTSFSGNTSTEEFNNDQQSFIDKFVTQRGYVLNPSRIQQSTMVKVTDKELGAPEDLFPNGLVLWYNPDKQSAMKGRDGSVLGDILDNQSVDRNVCRKNIEDYFKSFQRRNSIVIDPATLNKAKRVVQACKDEHYGKWGIAGGGNRMDNYLDMLSGNKEGGPLSDSRWRIE